jgi:hypothetical protein
MFGCASAMFGFQLLWIGIRALAWIAGTIWLGFLSIVHLAARLWDGTVRPRFER